MAGSLKRSKKSAAVVNVGSIKKKRKKSNRQVSLCSKVKYAKKYNKHKYIVFNKTLEAVIQDFGIEAEATLQKQVERADLKLTKFTQSHSSPELESAYRSFVSETSKLLSGYVAISNKKLLHLHKSHKVVNGILIPPINSLIDCSTNRKNKNKVINENMSATLSAMNTFNVPTSVSKEGMEISSGDVSSNTDSSERLLSLIKPVKVCVDKIEQTVLKPPPSPVLNLDENEYESVVLRSQVKKSVPDIESSLTANDVSSDEDDLMITNVRSLSQPGSRLTTVQSNISSSSLLSFESSVSKVQLIENLKKKTKSDDASIPQSFTEAPCKAIYSPVVSVTSFDNDQEIIRHGKKRKRGEKKKHPSGRDLNKKSGKDRNNKLNKIKMVYKRKVKRRLEMLKQKCNALETTSGSDNYFIPNESGNVLSRGEWPFDGSRYVTAPSSVTDNSKSVNKFFSNALSQLDNSPTVTLRSLLSSSKEKSLSITATGASSESQKMDLVSPEISKKPFDNEVVRENLVTPKRALSETSSLKPIVVLSDILPALTPNQKNQLKKDYYEYVHSSIGEPNIYQYGNSEILIHHADDKRGNLIKENGSNKQDLGVQHEPSAMRKLRSRTAPLRVKEQKSEIIDCDNDNDVKAYEKTYRSFKNVRLKKLLGYNEIVITSGSTAKKRKIKLCREYNFLCAATLRDLMNAFNISQKQKRCKAVLLTSVGPIFSSGLNPIQLLNWTSVVDASHDIIGLAEQLINILIEFDKPIIGAVQGPVVGFAASLLLFCDIIYASERAHFQWPCMQMGLSPYGCVTSLLSQSVGSSLSRSLLLQGKLLTAEQAHRCGLVTELLPHDTFMRHAVTACESMCLTVGAALQRTKRLLQSNRDSKQLHHCNVNEITNLKQCLKSNDCQTQLQTYILTQLHMS